ncbi:MAG: DUF47 family protein [Labilithrix sp.]|nr:DUF47 family protein [Labilithrix sp.]
MGTLGDAEKVMWKKTAIAGVLGERDLLLPGLVHEALAANGRAKYFFTLLQLAQAHADAVDGGAPDLRSERELAGVTDARLDTVVGESRIHYRGEYRIPFAKTIVEQIFADIDAMIAPLRAASPARVDEETASSLVHRRSLLSDACARPSDGAITVETLTRLTSSDRERMDSAHLLVVDLHKALNLLASSLATEDIDGAKAYGLDDADRPLVAAFMKGLHQTEALKLEHPGLGTMATRSGKVLILENDIGETSAHLLVVHVEGLRVVVTTTDVHLQRIEFFRQMLAGSRVAWADVRSRSAREMAHAGLFYECVGTLDARDRDELEHFLAHLGSRLVFLIDWNRARKVLRAFVPKAQSLELLAWAAQEGLGHRGMLEMGGARLVLDAMAAVVRTPLRFGERLDDVIGVRAATELLRFVLRTCSVGLRAHRSRSVLRAEIRAELSEAVRASGDRLLGPVADHAEVVGEIATALSAELRALEGAPARAHAQEGLTRVARACEHRGDEVVVLLRNVARRMPEAEPYAEVVALADDAVDAIEEAAFQLTLLPAEVPPMLRAVRLAELGDLVTAAARAYILCVTSARRGGPDGLHAVLDAFDEIVTLEHAMDDAERRLVTALAKEASGKLFVITSRVAAGLEHAVDCLTRASLLLRDHASLP